MKFLKALARGLARTLAITAYVVYLGAESVYRNTAAGSTQVADVDEVEAEEAESDEQREYRLWVAANRRQAAELRAEKASPSKEVRDLKLQIAYARSMMRGEAPHPDKLSGFAEQNCCREPVNHDDQRPTLH